MIYPRGNETAVMRRDVNFRDVKAGHFVMFHFPYVSIRGVYNMLPFFSVDGVARIAVLHQKFSIRTRFDFNEHNKLLIFRDYVYLAVTRQIISFKNIISVFCEIFTNDFLAEIPDRTCGIIYVFIIHGCIKTL